MAFDGFANSLDSIVQLYDIMLMLIIIVSFKLSESIILTFEFDANMSNFFFKMVVAIKGF